MPDFATVVKRLAGLISDKTFTVDAGKVVLSLGEVYVHAILVAKKNGTDITQGSGATQYGWVTGRPNIILNTATSQNDFFHFQIQTKLSDTAVGDYVDDATRWVMGKLVPHYEDTDLIDSPTIATLVRDIAAGTIRTGLASGESMQSAYYRAGHDMAENARKLTLAIQRGEAEALESDLITKLTRRKGAVFGSFRHADGDIENREDLRTRLAKWDQFATLYYPFSDVDVSA